MSLVNLETTVIDYDLDSDTTWVAKINNVTYYIPVTAEFATSTTKFLVDTLYWLACEAEEFSDELNNVEIYHEIVKYIKRYDYLYYKHLSNPVATYVRKAKTIRKGKKEYKLGARLTMFLFQHRRFLPIPEYYMKD